MRLIGEISNFLNIPALVWFIPFALLFITLEIIHTCSEWKNEGWAFRVLDIVLIAGTTFTFIVCIYRFITELFCPECLTLLTDGVEEFCSCCGAALK